jgi:hypothetical protein
MKWYGMVKKPNLNFILSFFNGSSFSEAHDTPIFFFTFFINGGLLKQRLKIAYEYQTFFDQL